MSPVPEWKFGAYVDGELSPAEMREVEAELVRSRRARELVVALREEASLLGDVLQERAGQLILAGVGERISPIPAVAVGA